MFETESNFFSCSEVKVERVSKNRNTKSAQNVITQTKSHSQSSDSHAHRNKSAPSHRVQSTNNIIHSTNQTYQPRQYSSQGNLQREITRTNFEQTVSFFFIFQIQTKLSSNDLKKLSVRRIN